MNIGTRIRLRRTTLNMTLQELGQKVGVGASTVRKWETGFIENVKSDKIQKLADALETTPAYIMGWEDDVTNYRNIEPLPNTYPVPIIGDIACGVPIMAEENIDGYAYIDERINADFALRCVGDSMINARIFDGDLVFIRKQPDVEDGEIAAIIIEDVATLKRVYHYKNRLQLRPENPTYEVLDIEGEDLDQVHIIGKAVAFLSGVR